MFQHLMLYPNINNDFIPHPRIDGEFLIYRGKLLNSRVNKIFSKKN